MAFKLKLNAVKGGTKGTGFTTEDLVNGTSSRSSASCFLDNEEIPSPMFSCSASSSSSLFSSIILFFIWTAGVVVVVDWIVCVRLNDEDDYLRWATSLLYCDSTPERSSPATSFTRRANSSLVGAGPTLNSSNTSAKTFFLAIFAAFAWRLSSYDRDLVGTGVSSTSSSELDLPEPLLANILIIIRRIVSLQHNLAFRMFIFTFRITLKDVLRQLVRHFQLSSA